MNLLLHKMIPMSTTYSSHSYQLMMMKKVIKSLYRTQTFLHYPSRLLQIGQAINAEKNHYLEIYCTFEFKCIIFLLLSATVFFSQDGGCTIEL